MMLEVIRVVIFVEDRGDNKGREHVVDTWVYSLNNNSLPCMFIVLCTSLHTSHEDNGPATSGDISTELVPSGSAAALSFLISRLYTGTSLFMLCLRGSTKRKRWTKTNPVFLELTWIPAKAFAISDSHLRSESFNTNFRNSLQPSELSVRCCPCPYLFIFLSSTSHPKPCSSWALTVSGVSFGVSSECIAKI